MMPPTTLAHGAAQGTPGGAPVAATPAARAQRMHPRPRAFLHDLLRPALAPGPAVATVGAAGLGTTLSQGYRTDSTGWGRPDSRHETVAQWEYVQSLGQPASGGGTLQGGGMASCPLAAARPARSRPGGDLRAHKRVVAL
jgi:hypothetical protein